MPRNSDFFQYLNSVTRYTIVTSTPGDTTTSEAILGTGAETSVDVVSSTNFTAADPVMIIGTGGVELAIIGTPATTMPVTRPLKVPQASGARMVEAVAVSMGHIGPEGVSFGGTATRTSIFASTARSAVSYFPAPAEMTCTIPLRYKTGLDLQAAFGAPDSETGDGLAEATAYAVHVGQSNIATLGIHCYRLQGVTEGGDNVQVDILGAYNEVNVTDVRGGTDPGVINIQLKMRGISQFTW